MVVATYVVADGDASRKYGVRMGGCRSARNARCIVKATLARVLSSLHSSGNRGCEDPALFPMDRVVEGMGWIAPAIQWIAADREKATLVRFP